MIPKSTFGADVKTINVRGQPFSVDVMKPVGINSLTINILCKKHNSGFGPVDGAGKTFIDKVGAMLAEERQRMKDPARNWPLLVRETDGLLLERWFLKAVINFACLQGRRTGSPDAPAGRPTLELVEIAFGRRQFTKGGGLYGALRRDADISDANIRIATIVSKRQDYVVGAMMALAGVWFGMSVTEGALPDEIGTVIEGWEGAQLVHLVQPQSSLDFSVRHLRNGILVGERVSQKLLFRWPEAN